jgi:hypothetical protein
MRVTHTCLYDCYASITKGEEKSTTCVLGALMGVLQLREKNVICVLPMICKYRIHYIYQMINKLEKWVLHLWH